NKPTGYICSRRGQGSRTVYDLLPDKYRSLKTAGRLDKESSGLLILTNNGNLANQLTHPRYEKEKVYKVKLNKPLTGADKNKLLEGVKLDDGPSRFIKIEQNPQGVCEVTLSEGRNRQIRRTFDTLGYKVVYLH